MDAIQALLIVIAVQLALAGVGWWLAGQLLGLSRAAALNWGGYCLACLLATLPGLFGEVSRLPVLVAWTNLCMVGGAAFLLRGVAIFLGRRSTARYDGVLVLAMLAVCAWDIALGLDPRVRSALASSVIAAIFSWGAVRNFGLVRVEFGRSVALLVCGPMLAAGLMYGFRVMRAAGLAGSFTYIPMTVPSLSNTVALLLLTTLLALFNLTLGYMVVTRMVRRLRHLSRHDSLTRLLNRRALLEALQAELQRERRGGPPWALLLIDVDHFKAVNDRHGHGVGDEVLCRVAEVIKSSAREVDTVARTGGEEFCVLAPMTDLHGAALLAERLRQAVADSAMLATTPGPAESGPTASVSAGLAVTISVGVALSRAGAVADGTSAGGAARAPVESADHVLTRADVALYRAKAAGRNRVELADEPA